MPFYQGITIMQSGESDNTSAQVITLIVNFDGEGTPGSHLYLYLFNNAGKLLECQPILYGKVTVVLTKADLIDARIFIGLSGEKRERFNVSQERMSVLQCHEVSLGREREKNRYDLSPVPESVWELWTIEHLWHDAHDSKKTENKAARFRLSADLPWV